MLISLKSLLVVGSFLFKAVGNPEMRGVDVPALGIFADDCLVGLNRILIFVIVHQVFGFFEISISRIGLQFKSGKQRTKTAHFCSTYIRI